MDTVRVAGISIDPIAAGPPATGAGSAPSPGTRRAARREKLPLRGTRGLPVFALLLAPRPGPRRSTRHGPARGGPEPKEVMMGNTGTLEVVVVPVACRPYRNVL